MLSYQHAFHAGNLADVHKHAMLAWMLEYLVQKDKPLTYIETHAGRGLYDLSGPEAIKTGEAAAGIDRIAGRLDDHPYGRVIAAVRRLYGPAFYPGSPMIADLMLRPQDSLHLAELHPAEHLALAGTMGGYYNVRVWHEDGLALANRLCPPEPRRGLMLIDPSFEVKAEYDRIAGLIPRVARKWNVGVIALWYPILPDARHAAMLNTLTAAHPEALRHEIAFPPARDGHGMIGSGLFVLNAPWGMDRAADDLVACLSGLLR